MQEKVLISGRRVLTIFLTKIIKTSIITFRNKSKKTFLSRPVRYFGTLFWDDIAIFWDENLLLFPL